MSGRVLLGKMRRLNGEEPANMTGSDITYVIA
jgi:hypothetical protein